ncbi:MAG: sugar transferase [Planctomycetes bacterium]|nr:sugar transferase [Planctomycetota bacterium]
MIIKKEQRYKALLLIADILGISAAYLASLAIRFYLFKDWDIFRQGDPPLEIYLKTLPYILIIWLVIFRFSGVYALALKGSDEIITVFKAVLFCVLISLSFLFFYREFEYSRAVLAFFAVLAAMAILTCRIIMRWLQEILLKKSGSITNLIIIGNNSVGKQLADEISGYSFGYNLLGFIGTGDEPPKHFNYPVLGKLKDIEKIIAEKNVQEIWIALTGAPREKLLNLVEICLKAKISWKMVPDLYEIMMDWVKVDSLGGIPLIGMRRSNITGLNALTKRILDLFCAGLLIILTSPVMLVSALLIKITSAGPVLFMQKRIGHNGKRFVFLKFRTMMTDTSRAIHKDFTKKWIEGTIEEASGEKKTVYKIKHDPRVTKIGKWLRKLSIDELPQLFNVIKGDMSLIGPRPALAYEIEHYKEWHKRRLETKPGVTGLWQVSGRNMVSFDEMAKLDIYYIENWSFGLDLNIIIKTVFVVLFKRAY